MAQIYKVTFNIEQTYGYIAYDESTKTIDVSYPDEKVCQTIKTWLAKEHEINTPDLDRQLSDFSPKKYLASRSKEDFQTVLTRIWEQLDIHIDWSFPADCI